MNRVIIQTDAPQITVFIFPLNDNTSLILKPFLSSSGGKPDDITVLLSIVAEYTD